MDLTQGSVLSALLAAGGRVSKSDLLAQFTHLLDREDPEERFRNRQLFKTLVNSVAFVKEIHGVRSVVLRKEWHPSLDGGLKAPPAEAEDEAEDEADTGGQREETAAERRPPIQLAMQGCKLMDTRVKRTLSFGVTRPPTDGGDRVAVNVPKAKSRPYALPLRMPPTNTPRVDICRPQEDPASPPESPVGSFRRNSSLHLRWSLMSRMVSLEPKESQDLSTVSQEDLEHKWHVKCAVGHWCQVYGLLLSNIQLAAKRDFVSGFTALHWAAKCGNDKMMVRIIDLAKKAGVELNINAKTYGGYTPLHIAALHNKEYVLAILVGEYGADPSLRDNRGKRPYHYLRKDSSVTLREMLGDPKAQPAQDLAPLEKEEQDMFLDFHKGLHSLSRFFQPHGTNQKK